LFLVAGVNTLTEAFGLALLGDPILFQKPQEYPHFSDEERYYLPDEK
jgi:hypothetical protein